jgi:hypothetical protein
MLYALGFSFYWIDLGFQQMADNVTVFVIPEGRGYLKVMVASLHYHP